LLFDYSGHITVYSEILLVSEMLVTVMSYSAYCYGSEMLAAVLFIEIAVFL